MELISIPLYNLSLEIEGMPYGNLIFGGGEQPDYLNHFCAYGGGARSSLEGVTRVAAADLPRFLRHVEEFKDIPADNFAVSRFALADFEPYDQGMFINYVMALEFLYVPDHKQMTKRFANRIAKVVGMGLPLAQQRELCLRLRIIYQLRSAIVHGRPLENSPEEFIAQVRGYCRHSIKLFHRRRLLDDFQAREEYVKSLDDFSTSICG